MTRLDRLEVAGFRGIVHSTLDFGGNSVVLGGANGTGKTAFVDAVEYLYTGEVATLAGAAGLGVRQQGPHIHAERSASYVRGHFLDPDAAVTRWLAGPVDSPSILDGHLRRGAALTFILRRSQLQAFIHARPAERYKRMADLIGLERLDGLQMVTHRAQERLERELDAAERELSHLAAASTPEGVDEADLLIELNARLNEVGFGDITLASLDEIPRVRTALVRRTTQRRPDRAAAARAALVDALRRSGHDRLRDALAAYLELSPSSPDRKDRAEMLELLGLLSRGRDILRQSPDADHCPLCESDINSRAVLAALIRRVGRLEEVSLLQQKLDRARDALDAALVDSSGRVRAVATLCAEAEVSATPTESLTNSISMLRDSLRSGATAETVQMAGRLESVLERWTLWASETIDRLAMPSESESEEDEDGAGAAVSAALSWLESAAVQRATAARARAEHERALARRQELEGTVARARSAAVVARTVATTLTHVRNDELQRVFDELQADLVHFYDTLHPGEGQHALAIVMDPRKRGSADLQLGFFDRTAQDPRAFSSEGHLDSLGLCIFLAFVRRFNGDWPLLVLDDVVATVDAVHKARIARLLFEEFGDRQLMITTHDGRWFNEIRRIQSDLGVDGVRNLVIESWSLDEGPSLRPAAAAS
jgi:hypothetical protein